MSPSSQLSLFDAHLHPEALSDQDLESLRYFGVSGALAMAQLTSGPPAAKGLLAGLEQLVGEQLPRLERAGIRAYAAVGVHPALVPRRGLSEVLATLPDLFRGGKVVAIGETGLARGGPAEEESFQEHLALARRLKLPVVVHTPRREKERLTRRALTLLRASGIAPEKVLVDHAARQTVRLILECGHHAGLTLNPDELSDAQAVALVGKLGSARLVLDSDLGVGAGDLLGMPRVVRRLLRAGISEKVVARLSSQNARELLRVG